MPDEPVDRMTGPADVIRASVSFLASCVTAHGGWTEEVGRAIEDAGRAVAALEGKT